MVGGGSTVMILVLVKDLKKYLTNKNTYSTFEL